MSVRREIAEYDGIFFTTVTPAIVSVNQVYTGGGFAGAAGSGNDNIPAAYLNLIMFSNDLLTSAELPMAAIPITAGAFTKQKITIGPIDIPAPGYVYIYVNDNSNSPNWVHFDDLKITHVHSPFVSGADYYPFGLTMSDREILTEPYRFGYQGQYAEEETETGWNSFDLRMYNARFGRWLSPDPYGEFASPYLGMGNNPTNGIDPDGGFNIPIGTLEFLFSADFTIAIAQATGTLLNEVVVTASLLDRIFDKGAYVVWRLGSGLKQNLSWSLDRLNGAGQIANGINRTFVPLIPEYGGDSWEAETNRTIGTAIGTSFQTAAMLRGGGGSFLPGPTPVLVTPSGTMPMAQPFSAIIDGSKIHNLNANGKKQDLKQVDDAAKQLGIKDRNGFSEYIHEQKALDLMGGKDTYTYQRLLELGREFLANGGY